MKKAVPPAVYVLAAGVFAMVTSEFTVAGLMPQLAEGLVTGIPQIGYLVTIFAVAMAVGGPLLTYALLKVPPKSALMTIFAIFLVGNVIAALATGYPMMVLARIISGPPRRRSSVSRSRWASNWSTSGCADARSPSS